MHGKIRRIETTAMNKRTHMNKRTCLLTFVVGASFLLSAPATAGVLYDNGPIDGNIGSWSISYNDIMTDSFTLTGTSTLTGVDFGIWVHPGDSPVSLEWRITDSVPDPGLGTIGNFALLTNTLWCNAGSSGIFTQGDKYS